MAQTQGPQDLERIYGKITAKAWEDPAFKDRLLASPTEVFREEGLPIPEGTEIIAKSVDDDKANFCGFASPRFTEQGEPTGFYDQLLELDDIVQGKAEGVIYYSLPPKPAATDFADQQLADVSVYLLRVGAACAKSGSGGNKFCGGSVIAQTKVLQTRVIQQRIQRLGG